MIELLLGIAGICVTISFVSLVVKVWEFFSHFQSTNIVKKSTFHQEEVRAKRKARYSSKAHETDWRDFAA